MDSVSFSGSIIKGSKDLYASSHYLVSAPNGAHVKIGKNEVFYQVESFRTLQLKKKFESHGDFITVKGNYTAQIAEGDSAKLYFSEKEAVSINKIIDSGPKRTFGEIFTIQGGHLSSSNDNLSGSPAQIKVTAVNKKGAIQDSLIYEAGRYLTPPENPLRAIDEAGNVIKIEMEFDDAAEASVFDRDFALVRFKNGTTKLDMSYAFPKDIKSGEMILSKRVLVLEREYSGDSVFNVPCQTCADFSPINKIPLMPPNSVAPHTIYNKAMQTIDVRLQDLERQIARVKAKN